MGAGARLGHKFCLVHVYLMYPLLCRLQWKLVCVLRNAFNYLMYWHTSVASIVPMECYRQKGEAQLFLVTHFTSKTGPMERLYMECGGNGNGKLEV